MAALLVVTVAVLVWLLVPPPARSPMAEVGADWGADGSRKPRRWGGARPGVLLGGLGLAAVSWVLLGPDWLPWLVVVTALGATTGAVVVRARGHRKAWATAQEVARGCQVVAGQLRIGQLPVAALQAAAEDYPVFGHAASVHRVGGDIAEALRQGSRQPGAGGLGSLAAAWQLAERSGAPMAEAADRVAVHLAERSALRRSVSGELAPARATGKLLAGLPAVGLAMGFMVGGSPDEFLVSNPVGRWMLALAVVLACVGVLWTEWIADHVERRTR